MKKSQSMPIKWISEGNEHFGIVGEVRLFKIIPEEKHGRSGFTLYCWNFMYYEENSFYGSLEEAKKSAKVDIIS